MPPTITSAHVNVFKRADGRAFLPSEIINEIPASLPAFQGFDERGISCPVATKDIDGEDYEALFKIKQNEALVFRNFNSGVSAIDDGYERRKYGIKTAGGFVHMDHALLKRGDAGVTAWEVAKQDALQRTLLTLEKQFFYGKPKLTGDNNLAKGFPGLQSFVHPAMTLDAEGTGPELASAYLVYFHQNFGVSWIQGKGGKMSFQDEKIDLVSEPGKPERKFPALSTWFEFYPGLACHGTYTVFRIANIDVSTALEVKDKNRDAFTDEMVGTAIAMWPMNRPNVMFTTRKAAIMLGASRNASMISASDQSKIFISAGQTMSAKSCDGDTIPVCVTDGLADNEKQWTA